MGGAGLGGDSRGLRKIFHNHYKTQTSWASGGSCHSLRRSAAGTADPGDAAGERKKAHQWLQHALTPCPEALQPRRTGGTPSSGCAAMAAGYDPWAPSMARDASVAAEVPAANGEATSMDGSLVDGMPMVNPPAGSSSVDRIGSGSLPLSPEVIEEDPRVLMVHLPLVQRHQAITLLFPGLLHHLQGSTGKLGRCSGTQWNREC